MNRATFALCLLLGALGASVVAIGVAHDLDRAAVRPTLETAVCMTKQATFAADEPESTIKTSIVEVEPEVPSACDSGTIELIVLTNGPSQKHLPTFVSREPTYAAPEPTLAELHASHMAELFAANRIPAGHLIVDGSRNVVQLNPVGQFTLSIKFTSPTVSIAVDGRLALYGSGGEAAFGSSGATKLPWQPLRLWKRDADSMIAGLVSVAKQWFDGGRDSIQYLATVVNVAPWIDRQMDGGFASLADRLGLPFRLSAIRAIQHVERPRDDKR